MALYLKEDLPWKLVDILKPEEARCLKFQRRADEFINQPDYFCIYFERDDIMGRSVINLIQARYLAEMYTNKINLKLQSKALFKSLQLMNSSSNKLSGFDINMPADIDVDSEVLAPIKNQIRNDYFITRYELMFNVKKGKLSPSEFERQIQKSKEKIINSVCASIEVCKKAVKVSLDNGLLPLRGSRERFAMDIQNPYNNLMPNNKMRITLPRGDGVGKKLIEQVNDLLNVRNNEGNSNSNIDIEGNLQGSDRFGGSDMSEESDGILGEIPNPNILVKAFNTFKILREPMKLYSRVEELSQNCRARRNRNNLKRKISVLGYIGHNDTFFKYLGKISREQVEDR